MLDYLLAKDAAETAGDYAARKIQAGEWKADGEGNLIPRYVSDAEVRDGYGGLGEPTAENLISRLLATRAALLEAIEGVLDVATYGATRMKTPQGIEASLKPVNKARDLTARIRRGEQ